MKLIDRYIFSSLVGAFLVGVVTFMVLLLAVGPLQKLIEMITQQGVPASTALSIFAYQLPYSLTLTFPMSVLLSILLVFGRMSSESEMVAIRAAGVSFSRILLPTLLFAGLATGATYLLAEWASPAGRERGANLLESTMRTVRRNEVTFQRTDAQKGLVYTVSASHFDAEKQQMAGVGVITYEQGSPSEFFSASSALWNDKSRRWEFTDLVGYAVRPGELHYRMYPDNGDSKSKVVVSNISESPFVVRATKRKREDMRADEIQRYVAEKAPVAASDPKARQDIGEMKMELARRNAAPFACLAFALIAAPLGLRHHRTSSSMGVGISLLILLAYYFAIAMTTTIGESAPVDSSLPYVAAWIPNALCAVLGVGLIWRANQ